MRDGRIQPQPNTLQTRRSSTAGASFSPMRCISPPVSACISPHGEGSCSETTPLNRISAGCVSFNSPGSPLDNSIPPMKREYQECKSLFKKETTHYSPANYLCYPSIMLESLLPFFYLFGAPAPQPAMHEPMMTAPMQWEAPAIWEDPAPMMEQMPMQQPKPDPVVTRGKQRIWQERSVQVRRKGHMQTPGNYGAERLKHAVEASSPELPSLEYTQRTHRGMVQSMRRLERRERDYPRGCAFPCAE